LWSNPPPSRFRSPSSVVAVGRQKLPRELHVGVTRSYPTGKCSRLLTPHHMWVVLPQVRLSFRYRHPITRRQSLRLPQRRLLLLQEDQEPALRRPQLPGNPMMLATTRPPTTRPPIPPTPNPVVI